MELTLQFGYGMMAHTRSLLKEWKGGTVILSPRDLKPKQLTSLAADVHKIRNGRVLLDPQFYLPHADHARLTSHDYWPSNYETLGFWSGPQLATLVRNVFELNARLGTSGVILPGLYAARVDDDWLERHALLVEEAVSLEGAHSAPLYATLALSAESLKSVEDVHAILDSFDHQHLQGAYIVPEHPNGSYLVDDPNWLANLLDLSAGLSLRGVKVILGYSNHQMLVAAAAGVDMVASGTWMNVRSFPPEKFRESIEDEIRRRATWYYSPKSLSEYKVPFLDIAQRSGLLSELEPPSGCPSGYASSLFSGTQPSSVAFSEQDSFRHYLSCLRWQSSGVKHSTYQATIDASRKMLDDARAVLKKLHHVGVRGQLRDFSESVDASVAAIELLHSTRGTVLARKW